MIIVSASILSRQNDVDLLKDINKSNIDYLHLDVMDKTMTNDSSFEDITYLKHNEKMLDIHIMSLNPLKIIDKYISLKPVFLTVQVECLDNLEELIAYLHSKNIKVGLALETTSNIDLLLPYLDKIDLLLVMSVCLGNSGSKFDEKALKKIDELVLLRKNYNYQYLISVDGGINDQTITIVKKTGVDMVVSGSYLVFDNNIDLRVSRLKNE